MNCRAHTSVQSLSIVKSTYPSNNHNPIIGSLTPQYRKPGYKSRSDKDRRQDEGGSCYHEHGLTARVMPAEICHVVHSIVFERRYVMSWLSPSPSIHLLCRCPCFLPLLNAQPRSSRVCPRLESLLAPALYSSDRVSGYCPSANSKNCPLIAIVRVEGYQVVLVSKIVKRRPPPQL
jgi:hypothetical protein